MFGGVLPPAVKNYSISDQTLKFSPLSSQNGENLNPVLDCNHGDSPPPPPPKQSWQVLILVKINFVEPENRVITWYVFHRRSHFSAKIFYPWSQKHDRFWSQKWYSLIPAPSKNCWSRSHASRFPFPRLLWSQILSDPWTYIPRYDHVVEGGGGGGRDLGL